MTREELLEWQAAQRAAGKSHGPTPMKDDTPKYMVRNHTRPAKTLADRKMLFFTHTSLLALTDLDSSPLDNLNFFCCMMVC